MPSNTTNIEAQNRQSHPGVSYKVNDVRSAPQPDAVVAVVLAAGASTRMGQPKALLDFDGAPAIALVLEAACAGGAAAAVVVTAPAAAAVRDQCRGPLPVTAAINEHPERGMLSSLQAALRQLPDTAAAFLIWPVDYPIVPAAEVRRLLDAFSRRASGQRLFIPSFAHRRGHPVLVDAALAPEFLALREDQTARAVMAPHEGEIVYVEAEDDRVLMDMDTPGDYQRCLERWRRG
jgi:molybdenum cofactor cytidylyltransferase